MGKLNCYLTKLPGVLNKIVYMKVCKMLSDTIRDSYFYGSSPFHILFELA